MIARHITYGSKASAAAAVLCAAAILVVPVFADGNASKAPAVGEKAPEIKLEDLDGKTVNLSELTKNGQVVVLVLRGYPGYQCPICSRQVGQFLGAAKRLTNAGASVVMVYPGGTDKLSDHAKEFVGERKLPSGFHFLLDPDYKFTNAWNLRWDAPRETAYPSTFVIGVDGVVTFAKVSSSHGGRASVDEVIKALAVTKPKQ